jgi:hypothetical protein
VAGEKNAAEGDDHTGQNQGNGRQNGDRRKDAAGVPRGLRLRISHNFSPKEQGGPVQGGPVVYSVKKQESWTTKALPGLAAVCIVRGVRASCGPKPGIL